MEHRSICLVGGVDVLLLDLKGDTSLLFRCCDEAIVAPERFSRLGDGTMGDNGAMSGNLEILLGEERVAFDVWLNVWCPPPAHGIGGRIGVL